MPLFDGGREKSLLAKCSPSFQLLLGSHKLVLAYVLEDGREVLVVGHVLLPDAAIFAELS